MGDFRTSLESDIFSLGMLLLNIWTGRPPFSSESEAVSDLDAAERIRKNKRPPLPLVTVALPFPEHWPYFWALLVNMWKEKPDSRLSSHQVIERLDHIFEDVALPAVPSKPKLTISIDVGTSQTAVAVAYVSKGMLLDRQLARVPTALLYSEDDTVGSRSRKSVTIRDVFSPSFSLVAQKSTVFFKPSLGLYDPRVSIPLSRLYADYLRYLLNHTRLHLKQYFGYDPWTVARDDATVILAHPNNWRSAQQRILQQAAVDAGIVTSRDVTSKLHFVAEAEAAASFALLVYPNLRDKFEDTASIIVCDTGGSTSDISSYLVKSQKSQASHLIDMEELDAPFSLNAGGVYVDLNFSLYFTKLLMSHLTADPQAIQLELDAMNEFESYSKRRFNLSTDTIYVKFGSRGLSIPGIGVRKGTLEVPGPTATEFFQISVDKIAAALVKVKKTQNTSVIILTGGYAECPHFERIIRERLEVNHECQIILAN
ncbi:hypothetical protein DL93DRAFT_2233927, partial [Clavulina sp. PMI_390]